LTGGAENSGIGWLLLILIPEITSDPLADVYNFWTGLFTLSKTGSGEVFKSGTW